MRPFAMTTRAAFTPAVVAAALALAPGIVTVFAPAAHAEAQNESDAMGWMTDLVVKSVNPSAFTVDLSDGHTYKVLYAADFHSLVPGQHITARYVTLNGDATITDLRMVK
ncbi:MAG: DUF1344 domain-containing protein [Rhodobacteraceae bacterium]|nr:DUF1344 domain-containing protein [Paracoccaceae bacterium]